MVRNILILFYSSIISIGCHSPKFNQSKDKQSAENLYYLYKNINKINSITGKIEIGYCSPIGSSITFHGMQYIVEKYTKPKQNNWATHKIGKGSTHLLIQLDELNRLIAYAFTWNVGKGYIATTGKNAVYIDESLPFLRKCREEPHE